MSSRQLGDPLVSADTRLAPDVELSGNAAEAVARVEVQKAEAAFASSVRPIFDAFRASGVYGPRVLAAALNSCGGRTARGERWHVSNVNNPVDRLKV